MAENLQTAYAKAMLVDRDALDHHQEANDVVMAERTLKAAYETDVRPIVAEARRGRGGAIDPVSAFRSSGYRADVSRARAGSEYVPPQSL